MIAALRGDTEIVRLLVESAGADINIQNKVIFNVDAPC